VYLLELHLMQFVLTRPPPLTSQHWIHATFKQDVTVNDFGIVVNKSDGSYCPRLIGFTLYDTHGHIIHKGRHNFSLSNSNPRVRSMFYLCVMKGNQCAAVRSIKINIFRCVDGGCDCIVTGIIARASAAHSRTEQNTSQHTDAYVTDALKEVFACSMNCEPVLSRIFAHIELVTNPSIVSQSITPVKSQTVESTHPASLQGGTFVHNILFPGATKLTVKFDKRSGKGSGLCGVAVMKVHHSL
jgi:hypothetical protein